VKRGWRVALGGGMPEAGASAEASVERGPAEEGSETSERVYDPLWTNALAFLDYLEERNMIQLDIHKARIGQFVLATGQLLIIDVTMLKDAWEKPTVKKKKKMLAGARIPEPEGNRHSRRAQQAQQNRDRQSDDQVENINFMIELLTILPHSIQGHLIGSDYRLWATLGEESLVGLSTDITLKHGSYVPGDWSVLGILDAFPEGSAPPSDPGSLNDQDALAAGHAGTLVGTLAAQLSPLTRNILGRPATAHGITPLLIFRAVSG
jgi:hypothetical protein